MAVQRLQDTTNQTDVELLHGDMDTVFGELNRGLDASQIADRSLTADKLRIASTTSTAFYLNSISAGYLVNGSIGVLANGTPQGQVYIATPYWDLFVDPTGVTPTMSGLNEALYASNDPWVVTAGGGGTVNLGGGGLGGGGGGDARDNLSFSWALQNHTSSTEPSQFLRYVFSVHNLDTTNHTYYLTFKTTIIAPGALIK